MGIAFDSTANSGRQTAASYSFNITVGAGGTNRLLVVGVSIGDGAVTVSGITAGGTGMAFIRRDSNGGTNARTELWQLAAPATGVVSVAVTLSAAPSLASLAGAISLTGVDQGSPVDANNGASTSTNAVQPSVSVTTVADNAWLVDVLTLNPNDATLAPASPQVQRWNLASGADGLSYAGSTKGPVTPAGAATMSWTAAAPMYWTMSAASFKPAAASGAAFEDDSISMILPSAADPTVSVW